MPHEQDLRDQRLINALTLHKETLTVTSDEATVTRDIGAVLMVYATAGSSTGSKTTQVAGSPAEGAVQIDRTNNKFVFNGTDAVTEVYVEYIEGITS